ncbi:MAG: BMC domain-containing protein [Deltaproteobacteria bacterium]|nr:BMC domain-containing protein [Deltaproteobacteria bacterium]
MTAPGAIARGPALGVIESSSIARGVVVADAALKQSPALLVHMRAVSGGKHLVILEGGVAEIGYAMIAARAAAGDRLVDSLELAAADPQVWPMLGASNDPTLGYGVAGRDWSDDRGAEAVAIVEVGTVCAALAAADAACKCTEVTVRDVRLAVDLAGRAFFTLTGTLDAIQAAADAASAAAGPHVLGLEIIAQPAPELRGRLFR